MGKTILVCGGRDFYKYSLLRETLEKVLDEIWKENEDEQVNLVAGEATGADFLAKVFALDEYSFLIEPKIGYKGFPADWKTYGKAAGSIRNQQMLDEATPDLVVAFPGGVGTADMVRRSKKAGVPVLEVRYG